VKRLLATLALTAALATAVLALPGPVAAANCGSYSGGNVIVKGPVSCKKARAIVKEFLKKRKASVQGFHCQGSSAKVRCKLGQKRISWNGAY
jgi:hypothetical protein